jgi:glycine cleavage system H lipoate-binding protein
VARTTVDGMWIESRGGTAEIGVTSEWLAGRKLAKIETVGKGARLTKGGAFLLLTVDKKKEVDLDAPLKGKLIEVRPELAKAVTAVSAIAADPDRTWIVRVALAEGAVADEGEDEDEDEDEDDLDADDLDDDE